MTQQLSKDLDKLEGYTHESIGKVLSTLTDIQVQMSSMSTTLSAVHEQTKKTNGRVNRLEDWRNNHEVTTVKLSSNAANKLKLCMAGVLVALAVSAPRLFELIMSIV